MATTRTAGNTTLVEYGIQTEGSDLRAHVSYATRRIYVYRTEQGVKVISDGAGKYRRVPVWTDGIMTARGYLVPPVDIPGSMVIHIPGSVWDRNWADETDTTSQKGDKAVAIVVWALKEGYFPLPLHPCVVHDHNLQVSGTDILIDMFVKSKIQVKCDYRAGDKALGGTGNLFLQTEECNPYQNY